MFSQMCFLGYFDLSSEALKVFQLQEDEFWGTWLAHSVECATLDLEVVSSSVTFGIEMTEKKGKTVFLAFPLILWKSFLLGLAPSTYYQIAFVLTRKSLKLQLLNDRVCGNVSGCS